jgi:hypothetical protein
MPENGTIFPAVKSVFSPLSPRKTKISAADFLNFGG